MSDALPPPSPMHPPRPAREQPVQRITTARRSHTADMSSRMRNYAISMGIRTACVICVAVVDHWTRWLFVGGAVILPYIAVLLANAGRERMPGRPVAVADAGDIRAISGPPAAAAPQSGTTP